MVKIIIVLNTFFFQIDDEKINQFYEKHLVEYERLKVFFLLKQALAPVIEGLIIMDRLLYLYEQVYLFYLNLFIIKHVLVDLHTKILFLQIIY